ncbi:hypothetical protein Cch01nite_18490 [Cellulomonas chitinilytica]|uniref:DUF4386 family protein n=1 Tax=Cellulomonas chitinilytica TaxID=398759 RepID=A0A919TYZ4_9CELL|nr:hypothetical protein [Cellulomonas chitinilytica]GIG21125.1 hypothetical protein Cch01nite_18490 [Cellulomonas chitinilytica]
MTITTTTLSRAAGAAAVVGGLLYIGVQINHPHLDLDLVSTTEWKVRQSMKVGFATLSLAGITGMYLRQVRRTGVLGLIGYVVLALGFIFMVSVEVTGAVVMPAIAHSSPGFVSDVLAVAVPGGHAAGDIGLMGALINLDGVLYLAGGLLFGIALFRAHVLARWAAALLALGAVATLAIPALPQVNFRLFAIPTGVALVGLGCSLWRDQRTPAALPPAEARSPLLDTDSRRATSAAAEVRSS